MNHQDLNIAGDIASVSILGMTLAQWLPSVAAIFTIVWTAIRIYETKTVQRWLGNRSDD